jgi:hypothetical protein
MALIADPHEIWGGLHPKWKDPNDTQLEIEFFWPLTEQIPLDLDYKGCDVKRFTPQPILTVSNGSTGTITMASPTWTTTATFIGSVEIPELVMKLDKQPNFVVKWLYKLLNINWKLK